MRRKSIRQDEEIKNKMKKEKKLKQFRSRTNKKTVWIRKRCYTTKIKEASAVAREKAYENN